jgi:uncharacterized membrane protein YhdT
MALSWAGIGFAVLQSICGIAFVVGSVGAALSLSAMTAGFLQFAVDFHSSGFRVPMLLIALGAALLNLWVLRRVWRLRSNPASQWRQIPVEHSQQLSERLQFGLSLVTLGLVAVEFSLHLYWHGSI